MAEYRPHNHIINPVTLTCSVCGLSTSEIKMMEGKEHLGKLEQHLKEESKKTLKELGANIQNVPKKLMGKIKEAFYNIESTMGTPVNQQGLAKLPEGYIKEWYGHKALVLILNHERKTIAWAIFPNKYAALEAEVRDKLNGAVSRITTYYERQGYNLTEPTK